MRALLVDVDVKYQNPTRRLIPRVLAHAFSLDVFGPGYVDEPTLRQGLHSFMRTYGPYKVIFLTEHTIFRGEDPAPIDQYRKYYGFDFPVHHLHDLLGIRRQVRDAALLRVGLLLESDFYHFDEVAVADLDAHCDLVGGITPPFLASNDSLLAESEPALGVRVTDTWLDYCMNFPERVFPLLHFVDPGEADRSVLSQRPHMVSVPGVSYARRAGVSNSVRSFRGPRWPHWTSRAGRLAMRVCKEPRLNLALIGLDNRLYRRTIRSSRAAYVDGSLLDYPVRKFFEVPVLGTSMGATPFVGMDDAGFEPWTHYAPVDPADPESLEVWLGSSIIKLQSLASAGQQLVLGNHSVESRARQIGQVVEARLRGDYAGTKMRAGKFYFM